MTLPESEPRLSLPPALKRVLPAARWERVGGGKSGAEVWRSSRFVVKTRRRGPATSATLQQERERLRWLTGRVPVPGVVGYEQEEGTEFLAMTRVPGIPMSDPDATLHPQRMVTLLARALREMHALPLRDCPFRETLDVRLHAAREHVLNGVIDAGDFDEARLGRTPHSIFNELVRTRPIHEDLVVTHGDACLPNFIVNGEFVEGLIDVGRAGIADRHMDLALAWRSARSNLGPEYAGQLLDEYGRALVDEDKLAYFLLLDELF